MLHANNLRFAENMFALLFLHTIKENFGKQIQHKMKEMNILRD